MRVLVVEDHKELAATIAVGLRREGMAVDIVFDGREALRHSAGDSYDVILLDRDLPKLHGDDVCRALVARGSRSRVLMLTAADTAIVFHENFFFFFFFCSVSISPTLLALLSEYDRPTTAVALGAAAATGFNADQPSRDFKRDDPCLCGFLTHQGPFFLCSTFDEKLLTVPITIASTFASFRFRRRLGIK